jgi:spermidine synthase
MVVRAAAKHFGQFNKRLEQQTHVVIHVEDARTYIAACRDRFDVIIGDLFTPWRPGEAGLACLEYFRAVFPQAYAFRNHLSTDTIPMALIGY